MFNDTLWTLLDSGMFDTTGPVNNALVGSVASILESQYEEGEALINNLSPKTADINGIVMWEQILGIASDSTLPLVQRQNIATAKAYRLIGALSKSQLTEILNLFSPSNTAVVIQSPSTYQVFGRMLASEIPNINALKRMVGSVLPAHLEFIPIFVTLVLMQMQPQRNMSLTFTRNTWANNGGIQGKNEFLDETAGKLDGTWLLNDMAHPDFDVFKVISTVVKRIISYTTSAVRNSSVTSTRVTPEQVTPATVKGLSFTRNTWANNGGLKSTHKLMDETIMNMDGTWNLDDAGQPNFDVLKVLGIAVSRLVSYTTSATKTNSIKSTRVVPAQPTPANQKTISWLRTTNEIVNAVRVFSLAFSRTIPAPSKAVSNSTISVTIQTIEPYFLTASNEKTSVTRVAAAFSQPALMTGNWVLDGSVNLSHLSVYPVTVKINGSKV